MPKRAIIAVFILLIPAHLLAATADWGLGFHVDGAYLGSNNRPENRTWRFKSSTYQLDRVETNMVRVYGRKTATEDSRWGLELSLQYGVDVGN